MQGYMAVPVHLPIIRSCWYSLYRFYNYRNTPLNIPCALKSGAAISKPPVRIPDADIGRAGAASKCSDISLPGLAGTTVVTPAGCDRECASDCAPRRPTGRRPPGPAVAGRCRCRATMAGGSSPWRCSCGDGDGGLPSCRRRGALTGRLFAEAVLALGSNGDSASVRTLTPLPPVVSATGAGPSWSCFGGGDVTRTGERGGEWNAPLAVAGRRRRRRRPVALDGRERPRSRALVRTRPPPAVAGRRLPPGLVAPAESWMARPPITPAPMASRPFCSGSWNTPSSAKEEYIGKLSNGPSGTFPAASS